MFINGRQVDQQGWFNAVDQLLTGGSANTGGGAGTGGGDSGSMSTAIKSTDENVASSTILQNDDNLSFPIGANEEWTATFRLDVGAALGTTGLKVAITTPSGATQNISASLTPDVLAASNLGFKRTSTSGTALDFPAATQVGVGDAQVLIQLWVLNGATAGVVQLQFAQSTSNAANLTIRKGSSLLATLVNLVNIPPPPLGEVYEGFGAVSGGFGKETIVVSSLVYNAIGGLAEALNATDKIITFSVAGTIQLPTNSDVNITKPGVTWDGLSAPGAGITLNGGQVCIKGRQAGADGTGSNIVFRGFRIRNAFNDGLQLALNCHDITIDHCSILLAADGCIDITEGAYNVTVNYCLLDNSLNTSAPGPSLLSYNARRVSYSHNIFYGGKDRNPILVGDTTQIYSTGAPSAELMADIRYNIMWGYSIGTYIISANRVAKGNVVSNLYRNSLDRPGDAGGIVRSRLSQSIPRGDAYIAGNICINDCRGLAYPYTGGDAYYDYPSMNSQNNQVSAYSAPAITGPGITDRQGRLDEWTKVRAQAGSGRTDDAQEATIRTAIVIPDLTIFDAAWNVD